MFLVSRSVSCFPTQSLIEPFVYSFSRDGLQDGPLDQTVVRLSGFPDLMWWARRRSMMN